MSPEALQRRRFNRAPRAMTYLIVEAHNLNVLIADARLDDDAERLADLQESRRVCEQDMIEFARDAGIIQ